MENETLTPITCPGCGEVVLWQDPLTGDAVMESEPGEIAAIAHDLWDVKVICPCGAKSQHQRLSTREVKTELLDE